MKKTAATAILISGLAVSSSAYAGGRPVIDSVLIHTVSALGATISELLYQIGHAITASGDKVARTVEAEGKADREYQAMQRQNSRFENARQRYIVPSSVCSESVTTGVVAADKTTATFKSALRNGEGITYSTTEIKEVITAPKTNVQDDAVLIQKAHKLFCDKDDHKAYGGSKACPRLSNDMPGADKRIDTLLIGAGKDGKTPDLTFDQKQAEVASLYIKNAYRPTIAPKLSKEQADLPAGAEYIGMQTEYEAMISAAEEPAMNRLARSLPNPDTSAALAEARQSASSEKYYQQNASTEAKKTGQMSLREFEKFDVYRRYGNAEYNSDLQDMEGDNLVREAIRVQSQTNALLLRLKDELELANIISGQDLAAKARSQYAPILQAKYKEINTHGGK